MLLKQFLSNFCIGIVLIVLLMLFRTITKISTPVALVIIMYAAIIYLFNIIFFKKAPKKHGN